MNSAKHWITSAAILALLAGCSVKEPRLQGKRVDVRDVIGTSEDGKPESAARANTAFNMPATTNPSSWTHRNGGPTHKVQHPALNKALTLVWSAPVGQGDAKKARITADPVVAGGLIYTLDSRAQVTATTTAGQTAWTKDVTPPRDKTSDASGGGLAVAGKTLYVTTGYGELLALDASSGQTRWRQEFDGPVQGSPTVKDGLVYVVSRDNRAFAVEADTGRLKWEVPGTPTPSVMVGGAGPAVAGDRVIFPFGSSEVTATLRRSGIRTWNAVIAGERRGRAYTGFTDITGDPVVVGNTAYVGTQSGRTVALDVTSGERNWTATEGAYSPVWPAGNAVFLVSDASELVRLDAATGEVVWARDLPLFKNERPRRRKAVFAHYGPVLAGGLLRVASDDGQLRSFDPASGALVSSVALPDGATSNPVVVNRTLYVVTSRGKLLAFR